MAGSTITRPFPYLLLPTFWASRNRARRREKGDLLRGMAGSPNEELTPVFLKLTGGSGLQEIEEIV